MSGHSVEMRVWGVRSRRLSEAWGLIHVETDWEDFMINFSCGFCHFLYNLLGDFLAYRFRGPLF